MDELNLIWEQVTKELYLKMISAHYNAFIRPLVPLKLDHNSLYINAITTMIKNVVNIKYQEPIQTEVKKITGKEINIVFLDPKDPIYSIIEKDQSIQQDGQISALSSNDRIESRKEKKLDTSVYNNSLNPRYTFDNFVKGKSNEFALAVAMRVAEEPGTDYNPLFIYGGSGLGKTHLMQAIGHAILEKHPDKKVLYITSENFVNELISKIGPNNKNKISDSQKFRDKYRNADVLMIDDIQFIAGKEGTQEELFHTFNSLREAKKQVILTSDKVPKDIKGLEERLVTRFEGGMLADIQLPDFETRVAILQHKMMIDRMGYIPKAIIDFIANNVTSSIRELEGAIIKVMAYYNVKFRDRKDVTDEEFLNLAREALAIEEKKPKKITLELIKEVVASHYNLSVDEIISTSRQQNIARPRQVAMYLSRKMTNLSWVKIANSFERDHATIMHGTEKIENMMEDDIAFAKEIKKIKDKIKE
ncbi:MAG: chromosomal replication initiator protein DnaA [Tissierellia bacterium]|nr:chromosomal replication initiator protein DnaA [Tissierellia bacterium]